VIQHESAKYAARSAIPLGLCKVTSQVSLGLWKVTPIVPFGLCKVTPPVDVCDPAREREVQGYLAHKKHPPRRTLQ